MEEIQMTGPLHGVRVVDITTNISGPTLTMILSDLGAEVIKIERPGSGDETRKMGPFREGNDGSFFLQLNRNKHSIVIDLKQEKGREIVNRFIQDADVFVENFRYGKAESLGLGYEQLKSINPRLIYASINAYGLRGPDKEKPGYDAIIQANSGLMGINGAADSDMSRIPVSILDQGSALWGALGVVSALLSRSQTGKGQKVDTSLYETGLFWASYHLMAYQFTGKDPVRMGSNHAAFTPYGVFQTGTQPIMIGVSNDRLFGKLCNVLEKPEWVNDPRYQNNPERVQNRHVLNYEIEMLLKEHSAEYWIDRLDREGVPASIINKISDVASSKQAEELQMFQSVDHSIIPDLSLIRLPLTLSENNLSIRKSPPLLGENTRSILENHGYDKAAITQLIETGVVADPVQQGTS
jgi:crotonobetainyl-CoA:carnitine CoA-transferase CaiB-like acyl-CoA transferase